jgi:hypothetical protein
MELKTIINIEKSPEKITYEDPVVFIGSCFASEIGMKLAEGKMPVMINPAGTVYNPVSVINTLDMVISGKVLTKEDLFFHDPTWLSFSHYTDFSSDDPERVIMKINTATNRAHDFLRKAHFLFITFGTARVFRLRKTGEIVSNCHKLPQSFFERDLLTVEEIVKLWSIRLDVLKQKFPELKIIFTISPVRHWKDGAHGNQVSKSVLILAVEKLLAHPSLPGYYPSYEIMMDELRDYRFYNDDMLHPSQLAIDYIWENFSACYLDSRTSGLWKEASKITHAVGHRITSENKKATREFADNMLLRISRLEASEKSIDLSSEKEYFKNLL